jgi:hypothetical protein
MHESVALRTRGDDLGLAVARLHRHVGGCARAGFHAHRKLSTLALLVDPPAHGEERHLKDEEGSEP